MSIAKIVSLFLLVVGAEAFTLFQQPQTSSSALRVFPEALDPTLLAGAAAVIGLGGAAAAVGNMNGGSSDNSAASVAAAPEVVDLSIPYDAAARLAYDEWRKANNKGAFDASDFDSFKGIYEEATVGMVTYKQMERNLAAQKSSYEKLEEKLAKFESA